jgi:protein-S-isoprenylcysteine O-methyltransferase Ste14
MYWLVGTIEMLVILASNNPSRPLSKHILAAFIFNGASPQLIRITPLFVVGNLIGLFGTALRLKCYRTLGRLFTFELCIQKDHRLIVNGPYAFIRHPSYTGLILTIAGAYCNHASGSWVRECGALETLTGKMLLSVWLSFASAVVLSLLLRVPKEDKILETKFGEEWLEWSEKVRYRLVPGLY